MKKSMTVVLILTVLLLGGCLESGIEGKYVSTEDSEHYLELNSDGTFFYHEKLGSYSGTYEVKGDKIRLITPTGRAAEGKIEGDTLIDPDGDVWKKV